MRRYDFNVEKLARLTGISERFLELFIGGKFNELPSAPYVRGYLREIGKLLNLNGDELWIIYLKDRGDIKSSGEWDKLPSNRFAYGPLLSRSTVIIALVAVVILGYLVVQGGAILDRPALDIMNPRGDSIVVSEPDFLVQGRIGAFAVLTLNGSRVYSNNEEGNFETKVRLQPGLNTFEFKVKRFLGKERVIIHQVLYQSPSSANDQ